MGLCDSLDLRKKDKIEETPGKTGLEDKKTPGKTSKLTKKSKKKSHKSSNAGAALDSARVMDKQDRQLLLGTLVDKL